MLYVRLAARGSIFEYTVIISISEFEFARAYFCCHALQALSFPLSNLDALSWRDSLLMAPIASALSIISISGSEYWGTESLQLYATGAALLWLVLAVAGAFGLMLWALLERPVSLATVKVNNFYLRSFPPLCWPWQLTVTVACLPKVPKYCGVSVASVHCSWASRVIFPAQVIADDIHLLIFY